MDGCRLLTSPESTQRGCSIAPMYPTMRRGEEGKRREGMPTLGTGASLVGQYPITLVHIVGFKIIKK